MSASENGNGHTSGAGSALRSEFAQHFPEVRGYLSACTAGLPSFETLRASEAFLRGWAGGSLDAQALGLTVDRIRSLYAGLAGVSPAQIAVGSQVSQLASIVASGAVDGWGSTGSEVLCAAGDFSSLTHPFEQRAQRDDGAGSGITIRYAPVSELAEAIGPDTALVVFSLVQSATGEVADHASIVEAAERAGARTFVDLTQSLGWLPVGAADFDYTVCHAYKWLCSPRGTAFLTVREGLEDGLAPLAAGWYSADDPWSSCYAGHTPLAAGAGRFDLSPVWPALDGTEAALGLLASLDAEAIHAHDLALANAARSELGLGPGDSAIVTWPDPDGAALAALREAGVVASGRAGNARIAFHLWNTLEDVGLLARALRP